MKTAIQSKSCLVRWPCSNGESNSIHPKRNSIFQIIPTSSWNSDGEPSRFGIVVLLPDFFAKNWPQYELNGLAAREIDGRKVILPIWHNVDRDDVLAYSPMLADKVALHTA